MPKYRIKADWWIPGRYRASSDAGADNRGFRRIHLTTKQKGLVVTTREGYYPT